mgnify:CR=1 FL=1
MITPRSPYDDGMSLFERRLPWYLQPVAFVILVLAVMGICVGSVLAWIVVKVFGLDRYPDPTGHEEDMKFTPTRQGMSG